MKIVSLKNVDKNGHFVNIFPVLWPFLAFLWPFLAFLWILFSTYGNIMLLSYRYNSFTKIILKKLKIYKIFTIFTIFTKKNFPKKSKARVKFSKKKVRKKYFFFRFVKSFVLPTWEEKKVWIVWILWIFFSHFKGFSSFYDWFHSQKIGKTLFNQMWNIHKCPIFVHVFPKKSTKWPQWPPFWPHFHYFHFGPFFVS